MFRRKSPKEVPTAFLTKRRQPKEPPKAEGSQPRDERSGEKKDDSSKSSEDDVDQLAYDVTLAITGWHWSFEDLFSPDPPSLAQMVAGGQLICRPSVPEVVLAQVMGWELVRYLGILPKHRSQRYFESGRLLAVNTVDANALAAPEMHCVMSLMTVILGKRLLADETANRQRQYRFSREMVRKIAKMIRLEREEVRKSKEALRKFLNVIQRTEMSKFVAQQKLQQRRRQALLVVENQFERDRRLEREVGELQMRTKRLMRQAIIDTRRALKRRQATRRLKLLDPAREEARELQREEKRELTIERRRKRRRRRKRVVHGKEAAQLWTMMREAEMEREEERREKERRRRRGRRKTERLMLGGEDDRLRGLEASLWLSMPKEDFLGDELMAERLYEMFGVK